MRVLLDVNVIVDILGATEDVLYSFQALDVMLLRQFEPCIAVSAMLTVQYALSARKYMGRLEAVRALSDLADLLTLLDVTESDFHQAAANPLDDFEDAMLAWCAARHGIDLIVTRNLRDFTASSVAVMTPQQFCDAYRPANYEYDLVELGENDAEEA